MRGRLRFVRVEAAQQRGVQSTFCGLFEGVRMTAVVDQNGALLDVTSYGGRVTNARDGVCELCGLVALVADAPFDRETLTLCAQCESDLRAAYLPVLPLNRTSY